LSIWVPDIGRATGVNRISVAHGSNGWDLLSPGLMVGYRHHLVVRLAVGLDWRLEVSTMSLLKGKTDAEHVERAKAELMAGQAAKGLGGQVSIDGDWLTINRKGVNAKMMHGLPGEKRIPIANITAVRMKEPGMTNGYITFSLLGNVDRAQGMTEATKDENSVIFTRNHAAEFLAIREVVEARIMHGAMGAPAQAAPLPDVADQLAKLAALRDQGVLTDEEFAAQKAKLLAQ
jgi:hypothetical protein